MAADSTVPAVADILGSDLTMVMDKSKRWLLSSAV